MLEGDTGRICSLAQGEAVMVLIKAVEAAREGARWVSA